MIRGQVPPLVSLKYIRNYLQQSFAIIGLRRNTQTDKTCYCNTQTFYNTQTDNTAFSAEGSKAKGYIHSWPTCRQLVWAIRLTTHFRSKIQELTLSGNSTSQQKIQLKKLYLPLHMPLYSRGSPGIDREPYYEQLYNGN